MTPEQIRTARAADHRARARDFADANGIAEAALVAAFAGPEVVHIHAAPDRLMPLAATLGDVLALTRNDSAVQERQGRYLRFEAGEVAHLRGPEVELLIHAAHWVHGFAVTEPTAKATKRSIQIFDAAGDAVHKIHLTPESDVAAFDSLVDGLRLADQPDTVPLVQRPPVGRALPAEPRTGRLSAEAVTTVLEREASLKVALRIAVGNPGCDQIFSGLVANIVPAGYWINVMDPRFNLHLRTDHLCEVWQMAGNDGCGLDAFDSSGRHILQVSTQRQQDWAALVAPAG